MSNQVSALPSGRVNPHLAGNYYLDVTTRQWTRMTTREREFADHVYAELEAGKIPGPTRLNELMGLAGNNHLGGNYSKIRISVFLGAGLVMEDGRYRWPR